MNKSISLFIFILVSPNLFAHSGGATLEQLNGMIASLRCSGALVTMGRNPELRYTKKQKPVCYLSVAVTDEVCKKTIWNKVVVWGKQAELASQYLKKGIEVFVQGRVEKKEFTTSEGEQKTYEEVNANLIGFSNL